MDDSEIRSLPTAALLARALELSREEEVKFREGFYEKESPEERDRRRREASELDICRFELDRRATDDIFDQAMSWAKSSDPVERELGVLLLGCGGEMANTDEFPTKRRVTRFFARSVGFLEAQLEDPDDDVVAATINAFQYNSTPEPILKRPNLETHRSENVRHMVAVAISGVLVEEPWFSQALEWLARLSADPDEDVRDWATFGLGNLCDADSREIREVLVRRLTDSHEDTRKEAIMGLARRLDDRVIPVIVEELRSDSVWRSTVEAAGIHGSAKFLEPLKKLRSRSGGDKEVLEEAIRNCRGDRTENFDLERVGGWRSRKDPSDK